MATAENIKKVAKIIKSDVSRRFVVVSAPGKRDKKDKKITDMLYECNATLNAGRDRFNEAFAPVEQRFSEIADGLGVDISHELAAVKAEMAEARSADFAASRGEYLSALILSKYLGFGFIDAKELIKFTDEGEFSDEYTNDFASCRLAEHANAVIPGFYGKTPSGEIKTFSRGGSDITGAVVARAANADIYENWTDVDGFCAADPRIVKNPRLIKSLSYRELRELSFMGADVLHADSVFAVSKSGIPINVKNTFNPDAPGTVIAAEAEYESDTVVTGISGKKNFTVINIEKDRMNGELGFARKILSVLEHYRIPLEHMPSGIDTLGIVVESSYLSKGVLELVVNRISALVNPDVIEITEGISVIATVGHGMSKRVGTSAKLFTALGEAGINVVMIDQGSSELNIIVGVENADYENAIRAIYEKFFA